MALTKKQQGVRNGIAIGAICTLLALGAGTMLFPTTLPTDASVADRLSFALHADVIVIFWLLFGIASIARHRFFSAEDIDGGGLTAGSERVKSLQAILQNTLEQTVLAMSVHMIWSVVMPVRWISAVLAAALLFSLGRLLFFRGYGDGAPSRALGFALTFYPSVMMLLAIAITMVVRSFT